MYDLHDTFATLCRNYAETFQKSSHCSPTRTQLQASIPRNVMGVYLIK